MLEFRYTHPRTGADVERCQAVRVPRGRPLDVRLVQRAELVCSGVMPSGMLRHPVWAPGSKELTWALPTRPHSSQHDASGTWSGWRNEDSLHVLPHRRQGTRHSSPSPGRAVR